MSLLRFPQVAVLPSAHPPCPQWVRSMKLGQSREVSFLGTWDLVWKL